MQSITRLFGVAILAGAIQIDAAPARATALWRDAPEYVALFAPANQHRTYTSAVTTASLETVLADAAADPAAVQAPGAWQPRGESPTDALGTAGTYNRSILARLYGSQQVRVARGARTDRGRVTEAWTLISPYPSADLRTLRPGTMRLILRVGPALARGFGVAGPLASP